LYPLERLWGVIYVWHTEELDSIAAGAVSAWAEEKLSHFGLARRVSDSLHQLCGILLLYHGIKTLPAFLLHRCCRDAPLRVHQAPGHHI
jgi:hypothetical protein